MSVQINHTQTTYNNSCIDKEKIMTHMVIVIIIILITQNEAIKRKLIVLSCIVSRRIQEQVIYLFP